jgi:hypothetical protein
MATLLNETRSFKAARQLIRATVVSSHQVEDKRRVLIVNTGSLLEAGVEMLLRREIDLQVSGCPFIGESALLRSVAQLKPDVIIMNDSSEITVARVLELLADKLASLQLIVVQSRDNTVDVYQYQRVTVTEVSDLLGLIRTDTGLPD